MKKALALILALVMSLSLLTACGSDPVLDDLTDFLNVQMVDVNANYDKITAEAGLWADYETIEQLIESIDNVLMPAIDDSTAKLAAIQPATAEVQELKDKYQAVMEAYKEGFETYRTAALANDEEGATAANAKIEEGVALLDEYNAALEALAEAHGSSIDY